MALYNEWKGLTQDAMIEYLKGVINRTGLLQHNLESFNDLITKGLPEIIKEYFRIEETYPHASQVTENGTVYKIALSFSNLEIGKPKMLEDNRTPDLLPNTARLSGKTYAGDMSMDIKYEIVRIKGGVQDPPVSSTIQNIKFAALPIMVGSEKCHTHEKSPTELKSMQEDPTEKGGYFIAKGMEWAIEWSENIAFNTLHVHKKMQPNEQVRGEFISLPNRTYENSSQLIIRLMENGSITVDLTSTNLNKTSVPFYILFRLFGMSSDREIIQTVVYETSAPSALENRMIEILRNAIVSEDRGEKEKRFRPIKNVVCREEIAEYLNSILYKSKAAAVGGRESAETRKLTNKMLFNHMNRTVLPHIGRDSSTQKEKLRYLGMLIHKMLLVHLEILLPTDRDSYSNKRIHGPGVSYAKSFKTLFNNMISTPIRNKIKNYCKEVNQEENKPLNATDISARVRQVIVHATLSNALEQTITSSKTITNNRTVTANRVVTQSIERKNQPNLYSALRSVSSQSSSKSSSKQTERADNMRRIHSTYPGYICIAKSADTGEGVGMKKELACTATITTAGEADALTTKLLEDKSLRAAARVETRDLKDLPSVFVNGSWVGCCDSDPLAFTQKYRQLRRQGADVRYDTTIAWNPATEDINFQLEVGRIIRPLLIVYNNLEEYLLAAKAKKPVPFRQWVRLTPAHIRGLNAKSSDTTLESLRLEGVIEYITPPEAENCLLAMSIEDLRREEHNPLLQYTHCDLEQAIFGLTTLISPYASHTQPVRVTYETNQGRQAGGWYTLAWPHRLDKNRFVQHYTERPLVSTLAYEWLQPNGTNAVVAYMISEGYNQEDSAIFSQAFLDRAAFGGLYFKLEKVELESFEEFGKPNPADTREIKNGSSYEKLNSDGFAPKGTRVTKGDVIIGRTLKAPPQEGGDPAFTKLDRSIIYKASEPATVDSVTQYVSTNGNKVVVMKLVYFRPLGVGDKISSRQGNKSICALCLPESDLPYDEDGLTPDIIINPHSIPTRMIIGQMFETSVSMCCQEEGVTTDATVFRKIDYADVERRLEKLGLRASGKSRMFCGKTGRYYDAAIFMGPTFIQRIQKFVNDDEYVVGGHGPTDPVTGQPLDGKNAKGGLRIGEMENWVLESHGAAMTMHEKMFLDSDGCKQFICRGCGSPAVVMKDLTAGGKYRCKRCAQNADIAQVHTGRASLAFQHEMRSANVKMVTHLAPREFT